MRKPAWQRLAESYTSGTLGRSRKIVGEEEEDDDSEEGARAHRDDAKVESKAGTLGSGGGGGSEVGAVVVEVQKPKAVLAVGWAA